MAVRQKKQEQAPPGSPAWMATFSDMITQVLAFFIMLFSFSSINEHKYAQAIQSLQNAFGVLPEANQIVPNPFMSPGTSGSKSETEARPVSISSIEKELKAALTEQKANEFIRVERREGNLVLHFDSAILFDSGKFELKERAIPALDAIGEVLAGVPNKVRIEGHTDSDPIIAPTPVLPDNYALSSWRAMQVLHYLTSYHGVEQARLSISAYADAAPVAPNDTPENKAKNRRVDIVVLSQ